MNPDNLDGTVDHQAPQDIVIEQAPLESAPEPPPPPVAATLPQAEPVQRPAEVVVAKGDTLYSLARDNDLKVAQLARWNFIRQPYRIRPGQRLRLYPPGVSAPAVISERPPAVTPPTPAVSAPALPVLPARVSQWAWPVSGRVIKTFSQHDTDRKGIGIAGHRGQAVKAAADGQVVYSGNGLISYGNLVIIKHSNTFLSAYAHNRTLLVKEGEQVRAGQDIASMGAAERGKAMLHFEIRKNGKPVDPLRYLPRTRG
jgi:lipoprotein NlpD